MFGDVFISPPPQGSFRHAQTGNTVSREELMMVLAALDSLLIRALHSQFAHTVSLRGAVLEGAKTLPAGRHANSVEICMCPANYLGDSCQVNEADSLSTGDFSVLGHIGYIVILRFFEIFSVDNNQNLKDILEGWFGFVNMKHFVLMILFCLARNVLRVTTEIPSVCFLESVFPATVMVTQTAAWMALEYVW